VKFISRHMRVTPDLHDQHFFVAVPDERRASWCVPRRRSSWRWW
jgi:hypothetical protein